MNKHLKINIKEHNCFRFHKFKNKPLQIHSIYNIYTGIPHLMVLCFTALQRYSIFYKLQVCGNKSVGATFPTAFAHFVSMCHILVILAIF